MAVFKCFYTFAPVMCLMREIREQSMKWFSTSLLLMLALCVSVGGHAQEKLSLRDITDVNLPVMQRLYRSCYMVKDAQGHEVMWIECYPVIVYPNERFRNKADEQFYWRTVRDVKRTLPYAKLINRTLQETYEYLGTFNTKKEKDTYLKHFEHDLYAQYKPVMKKFTKNQGKMMIKLINRETNQNSYAIVKAFMGTFRAGFWQTFGRFFGVNLKSNYNPRGNKTDAMIERICVRVEQGQL